MKPYKMNILNSQIASVAAYRVPMFERACAIVDLYLLPFSRLYSLGRAC